MQHNLASLSFITSRLFFVLIFHITLHECVDYFLMLIESRWNIKGHRQTCFTNYQMVKGVKPRVKYRDFKI